MIAVLFGLAALVLAGWPLALTMTGTLNRLQFSLPQITAVDEEEMEKLVEELKELEDARPTKQLKSLTQKRDNLADVLGRRLDAGEVTSRTFTKWRSPSAASAPSMASTSTPGWPNCRLMARPPRPTTASANRWKVGAHSGTVNNRRSRRCLRRTRPP